MPIYKTGKVKDGKAQYRVIVNYTDGKGVIHRPSRCVYGKREAADMEAVLKAQAKDTSSNGKMTVHQLYDKFIAAKKHDIRISSLNKSKSILENHVLNTDIANIRLDKLSADDCQEWKNALGEKALMTSTKNNAYRELNALLNYAVKMEYIPKNPLKNVGRFKDKDFTPTREKIRYYTPEEFNRYIEIARDQRRTLIDYGCYIFFNIAFYTGMRKGEIHALKWSDIEGDVIHITRSVNQKVRDGRGNYLEGSVKTKSSIRDVKIPQCLIALLEEHKAVIKNTIGYSDDLRVCGGYKPISDTTLENKNKLYHTLARLPHRTIHEFRHSHASVLCNANINIMEVSRRLGHADVKETWKTYAHLYPAAEEMAVQVLDTISSKAA